MMGDYGSNQEQHRGGQRDSSCPGVAPCAVWSRHFRLSLSQCKKRKIRERVVGDKKEREHGDRSEEHTSELQSHLNLVCRLLLEKKKKSSKCRTQGADTEIAVTSDSSRE